MCRHQLKSLESKTNTYGQQTQTFVATAMESKASIWQEPFADNGLVMH